MKVSELIKRLEREPQDAEVLMGVAFARYHTTDGTFYHKKEHKVVIDGGLWEGDRSPSGS